MGFFYSNIYKYKNLVEAAHVKRIDVKGDEKKKEEKDGKEMSILDGVSEYIFDLFDANCMEEYEKIEEIERDAMVLFADQGTLFVCSSININHGGGLSITLVFFICIYFACKLSILIYCNL